MDRRACVLDSVSGLTVGMQTAYHLRVGLRSLGLRVLAKCRIGANTSSLAKRNAKLNIVGHALTLRNLSCPTYYRGLKS